LPQQNAFLDTTVILSKEFGSRHIKDEIEKSLGNKKKFTTKYACMEINRTFLKDAIFLHSLLVEEMDLSVVFKRVQFHPKISQRITNRCLDILSQITDKGQLRVEDSIARLANLITGLRKALLSDISIILSGTDCPLADENIVHIPPIYIIETRCTRNLPECRIVEFLEEKRDEIRKIWSSLASDESFGTLYDFLSKMIGNEKIAKGRNCQKLGDIIICLDSPNGYTIYSTNIKDFAIICKSLGKPFIGIKVPRKEKSG